MQDKFHENLKSMPKCTFFRKKQRLVLDIEAKFTTGYEIERSKKPPIIINPDWSKSALIEIQDHLPIIESKIKKTDDFDFNLFEAHINRKLESFPTETSELEKIKTIVSTRKKEEHEKLDDWQKLGIDWEDYHPSSKAVVNHPFQWSCTDEFSPNGNDNGADTLELFRTWNKRNRKSSTMEFLSDLISRWNVDKNDPDEPGEISYTYFQIVVGLAFSSAKIRGYCSEELKILAISLIDKYIESIADEKKWPHKEECEKKQKLNRATIEKMPNN